MIINQFSPTLNTVKSKKMKTKIEFSKKYAAVEYSRAALENYNPRVAFESDDVQECEDYAYNFSWSSTQGCTLVENDGGLILDLFLGEEFNIPTIS
jgi:hypothetical protein